MGCCDESMPIGRGAMPKPAWNKRWNRELASFAKALAHPARVQILRYLATHAGCVCGDIVDVVPLAQSTVSQHLKVLKGAGMIRGDVEGTSVCYCVEPEALSRLKELVQLL